MRRILLFLGISIITLQITTVRAFALNPTGIQIKKEIRQEIKEEIKEKIATRVGILKKILGEKTHLEGVSVTVKNEPILTITKDGKTYTVNTTDKTKFRRKFWGKSSFEEISVGDILNVNGNFTNDAKTEIQALLIRNISIQKRHGVFFGIVKSITDETLVLASQNRGDQTVTISKDTRIINRKEQVVTESDLVIGHKIRVKGLWNNQANTITEVTQIKDFSIPSTGLTVTPAT